MNTTHKISKKDLYLDAVSDIDMVELRQITDWVFTGTIYINGVKHEGLFHYDEFEEEYGFVIQQE
jgi:hypothetical protein